MPVAVAPPAPPMSVRGAWDALRAPTGADLIFSAKLFLAVALSLLVGFSQNLENPYWAALTVYSVASQPQAGAIRSKALFRLVGTALGGGLAVVLAGLFGSHVGVELVVTLVAVVLIYYAKGLDRTPAGYTWFATSLTLAVIGIVHVQQPQTIFPFAAARVAEISLGILMLGLVDAALFPVAATPAFVAALRDWHDQAADWMVAALDPAAPTDPAGRWQRRLALRRLLALLVPLDAQGVQLPWDVTAAPPTGAELRLTRVVVARLLAHLSAANLWIEAARTQTAAELPLVADVRAWLARRPADAALPDHAAAGEALAGRLRQAFADRAAAGGRDEVLAAAVHLRLGEVVDHWASLEQLRHRFATGARAPAALRRAARAARPVRSLDYLVGALDVVPLVIALTAGATIWFLTAWSAGIFAMLFSFVVCGFIIGTPGAVRSATGASLWTLLAFALTFLYLFVVLPRVTAFPVLLAVLAVGLLPLGVVMAMTPAALLVTANGFAFLGLQNAYAADFGSSLQSMAGSLSGCLLAVGALHLGRYDRPRLRARRLARALDRDVADVARTRRVPDPDRLLSLSVDRLAAFFGIAAGLPSDDPLQRRDLVVRLRVLGNLAELGRVGRAMPAGARGALADLRRLVAATYRQGGEDADRPALLARVEAAYDALCTAPADAAPADAARARGLAALTGLRLAWTPDPAFEALVGTRTA